MNKKIITFISLLFLSTILIGCEGKNIESDAVKFKNEYESLNEKVNDSGKKYVEVSIDDDNVITYSNYNEVMDILNNGTGVIYFGFPECPWCRNVVPILLESAEITGINKIYYYNALSIRDTKVLNENGTITTEKEGTEEYYNLISVLSEYLGEYKGLNDTSIKRLYFPTVVFVKDGEILGLHVGTVSSQTDPYIKLNEEQTSELKNIYVDYMHKVLDDLCDESC